jgi:hypothetical protein
MVRLVSVSAILSLCIWYFSCCPKETAHSPAANDGSPQGNVTVTAKSAAVAQKNASSVTAVVDSIRLGVDGRYALSCRLKTAAPLGSLPSFAQPGQQVTLEPDFETDLSGKADTTNPRNRRLAAAARLAPGTEFSGTIALRPDGRWYLLDHLTQP